jgi:hypothetical protein
VDPHADIPPLVLLPLRAHVLFPDIHPPAESGRPVGEEEFPVISEMGRPLAVKRESGKELRHFPARLLQRPDEPSQRAPRPYRVQQQAHPDARPGPRGEGVDEPLADGVDVEDEELGVDVVPGLLDQSENRPIRLFPLVDDRHPVPGHRRGGSRRAQDAPAVRRDGGRKSLRPDPILHGTFHRPDRADLRPDVPPDTPSPHEDVQGNSDHRQQGDREHPGDRRRGLSPLENDARDEDEGEDVPYRGEDQRGDPPTVVQEFLLKTGTFLRTTCRLFDPVRDRIDDVFVEGDSPDTL